MTSACTAPGGLITIVFGDAPPIGTPPTASEAVEGYYARRVDPTRTPCYLSRPGQSLRLTRMPAAWFPGPRAFTAFCPDGAGPGSFDLGGGIVGHYAPFPSDSALVVTVNGVRPATRFDGVPWADFEACGTRP
jgi:hypothetical protein